MDTKSVSNIILFSTLLLISLALIILSDNSFIYSVRTRGSAILLYYQELSHNFFSKVGDVALAVWRLEELEEEYDTLLYKEENVYFLQQQVERLTRENDRLSELLQYSQELEYGHITAKVTAVHNWGGFSSFTINVGSDDGVEVGYPVLALMDDMLALSGKIYSTSKESSTVISIFDTGMHVAARLAILRSDGLVSGGGTRLIMRYIDSRVRTVISYDDLVVTAGVNSLIPADIPIGKVRTIRFRPEEAYIELGIEPIVSYNHFEYVFIVTSEKVSAR